MIQVFDQIDVDGGGEVSVEELQLGFQKAGIRADADDLIRAVHIANSKLSVTGT